MTEKFSFAIDRGGTFTDVFALCPGGKIKVMKLLSDDPTNYKDAPREGIRRILSEVTGKNYALDDIIDTDSLDWIRMGTTVATNALLERKGERIALVISAGFRDVLHIGNQSRPKIFSLEIDCPENLYEEVIEVEERIVLHQDKCEIKRSAPVLIGTTGENIKVWTPLNEEKLRKDLKAVHTKGINSLAVVLMHSYLFPDHELYIKKIANEVGFEHISLSSEIMPMVRIVPRGHTACVDAYLTPCIKRYTSNFASGFANELKGVNVLFMQSDGGLTPMNLFCGSRAILSGPAGGVVGYSKTTYQKHGHLPVIGFDMGGTSTDVSRYDGNYDHVYDTTIAGVNVQAPQQLLISNKHNLNREVTLGSLKRKMEFGFIIADRPIVVDDIRIRGVGNRNFDFELTIDDARDPPECKQPQRGLLIKVVKSVIKKVSSELDMIQLSIFSHRFMSIAEQMGKVLQRTSVSTNIKERLDFSCALFGPEGGLVSNAPHIPVHLGAMQEAVQFQLKYLGDNIHDGDVILSNHPCAGGSHLPDLTVITPVFFEGSAKPVFFVACRGHHADIGGLTPGSMPPHSASLLQEGATFVSFKLVKDGIFQEEEVTELLKAPANLPGCSGTRNLSDNLSDLRSQVAANKKGIILVHEIISHYGLEVVQSYMKYIQENAELAVRDMLREIGELTLTKTGASILEASDYMDDGSKINLKITINVKEGSAIFDFEGTGYEVYGNCNAPKAVTLSAIIYCLRCMVGHDVPLNQGCLAPVKVLIPPGSILNPSDTAAVVGGNVLTSQRVVDVIFKAFKTCAASQGCMNNITFGDASVGYYETVAGGAGAGPHWHGRSGVHTHMTNTRITDPEILERRYPVILEKFHLNPGTGGKGKFIGGDGILRKMIFRKDLTLSVLTERRVFAPYGLEGGEDGKKGINLLVRNDGRIIYLGAKNSVRVRAGDAFLLQTPGGGGYGKFSN
ncbi:5-oxoprolinase [Trichonephila clavata]|uniref:5-oxoprolinase n=1 Tax=Trichonephila clavata TaxID=2740835 RepID=A0A8X6LYU3_TRICU|nr:5-oxoprolinase [Trichonephila clavata]